MGLKQHLYLFTGVLSSIAFAVGGLKVSALTPKPFMFTEVQSGSPRDFMSNDAAASDRSFFSRLSFQFMPKQLNVHVLKEDAKFSTVSDLEDTRSPVLEWETKPDIEPNGFDPEEIRFNQAIAVAIETELSDRPFGEIMQAIAEQFLGSPYVAGLLDRSHQETLTVTLQGFDCVLFIETVLAIARGVARQDYTYENFRDRIEQQRYRNGQLNGYCSRLHYFSDWIDDNQNRQIVRNITESLGGIPLNATLNFMTQNRQYYHQLATEENYQCIRDREAKLVDLKTYYIPQDRIATIYPNLQPGDIIATATDIPGLDVTHTGLVYRFADGRIGFIHASPSGEVTISRDLQSYVQAVDGQIGIIVARPF